MEAEREHKACQKADDKKVERDRKDRQRANNKKALADAKSQGKEAVATLRAHIAQELVKASQAKKIEKIRITAERQAEKARIAAENKARQVEKRVRNIFLCLMFVE